MPLTAHPTPAYPIPVTATSVTGRRKPEFYKARKRQTTGAFCLPVVSLWRTARGSRKAGRCPCRPVFLPPRLSATPAVGKQGGGLPGFLQGVMP